MSCPELCSTYVAGMRETFDMPGMALTAWHVTIGGALLSTDIASCHISLPLPPGL